jgi:alanine racemase
MAAGILNIDLDAISANWRALDASSDDSVTTGAVVKADGYGLGAGQVAKTLARAGVRQFFVALACEGAEVRAAVGPVAEVFVFSGHMKEDTEQLAAHSLTPLLNSAAQLDRHLTALPGHAFGVQLDTGMNRLGMEPAEFAALQDRLMTAGPTLLISHLACADEPDHPQNNAQLKAFRAMTDGLGIRRSLAATGGTLLGPDYHFDLCRPGIGLYGGLPFAAARSAVRLSLPVVQTRDVARGESVGYSATWRAKRPSKITTLVSGYADGLIRAMGAGAIVWAGATPCPLVGRVSMDLLAVDVTDLAEIPDAFDILGPQQTVDQLAEAAGTIGYEILTGLGARYNRVYTGG